MIQRSAPPIFPEALDDDDDDVTWALQTAGVQWKRGAHADAVEWLRRAAESAVDSGRAIRARELTQQTNALEAALNTGWVPRLSPSSPPPASNRASSGSLPPLSPRGLGNSRNSTPPPGSARPFPLRTPRPPANPFSAPPAVNPFASAPAINPFSSGPADMGGARGRARRVSDFDGNDLLEHEAYGELAVDIDVPPASLVPPQSLGRMESLPATEVSDDDLIEEVEPLDEEEELEEFDDADVVALSAGRHSAPRAPMVSAPEVETGPALEADFDLQASEFTEDHEDDERPTLPPSSSNRQPQVLVPSSLRDEIDELLGKSPRSSRAPSSSRGAAATSSAPPEPAKREAKVRSSIPASLPPEDDEPTERSLEAAPELRAVPTLQTPSTPVEQPPEETTERDLDAERLPSDPAPSSRERNKVPQSEPGTAPDLKTSFANSDSTPPTEPSPDLPSGPPSSKQPDAQRALSPAKMPNWAEPARAPAAPAPESDPPVILSVVPTAFSEPAPPPAAPASHSRPSQLPRPTEIGGISLAEVPGLEDLPDESQAQLVQGAEIHTLTANEEVAGFGLALVLDGAVTVMPEVADVAAAQARRGELVFSQGHLVEGIRMRVVAGGGGAQVATWPFEAFSSAITACPWVGDELKRVGDRFQALAGVTMGPMGDQLDDMLRALVIERCEVKYLLPGEVMAQAGKPVPGMVIVGAGRLEVLEGEGPSARVVEELHPGDFLFAPQILQASPAPGTARAGKGGALVLFAERKIAHELLVGVPPLLGIFAC